MLGAISSWLRAVAAHPDTAGRPLDDPATVTARRRILADKSFLRRIYHEWYDLLAAGVPPGPGAIVELGSGAGFIAERIPGAITSDILPCAGIQLVADGQRLPLRDATLRALVLVNALHHLPDVAAFFREATRCLRPGGAVVMVEPWLTPWSRLVYARLQDEPCRPGASDWRFAAGGPLSGANLALPWIVFCRDRRRFERSFPGLRISSIRPTMPLSYLLSGGIATRVGLPGWSHGPWRRLERTLAPLDRGLAMFACIRLVRTLQS